MFPLQFVAEAARQSFSRPLMKLGVAAARSLRCTLALIVFICVCERQTRLKHCQVQFPLRSQRLKAKSRLLALVVA